MAAPTPTVILGAGIIGCSIAYYLSEHQDPSSIHIVEPANELFSSASGYAGGFLARDWHGPATAQLAALSFEEHRRLAEEHCGRDRWGYSATVAIGYAASAEGAGKKRGDDWLRDGTSRADAAPTESTGAAQGGKTDDDAMIPGWLRRREGDQVDFISASDDGRPTTAQVDPALLCAFLLQECVDRGVTVHQPARVVEFGKDAEGNLATVSIVAEGGGAATTRKPPSMLAIPHTPILVTPCTRLIVAAGAWSGRAFGDLFPDSGTEIPVGSLAGHSVVFKSPRWHRELEEKGCHTVFTTADEFAPEIFARLGGGIYFAGLNSDAIPLPDLPGTVWPDPEAIQLLMRTAGELMGSEEDMDDLEVVQEGLCFRPVTPRGVPIVSRVSDDLLGAGLTTKSGADGGVYLATGHGPWGISLSLGTGKVLAEMAQGRAVSADVSAL
ncbi:FAD dependent oxidoreductase, partial [Apodospora peruviana]